MGIVESYLKIPVHKERSELYSVTNTMSEDFKFEWRTSQVDYFEIPAGSSVTFPADMAFHACIELAKKISYGKNPKLGMLKGNWLPIAEEIISPLKKSVPQQPQKTEAQKARELVNEVNEATNLKELTEKDLLIKELVDNGFRVGIKNSKEEKTFSKVSGVKTLQSLLE